jgi:hypothetical protein
VDAIFYLETLPSRCLARLHRKHRAQRPPGESSSLMPHRASLVARKRDEFHVGFSTNAELGDRAAQALVCVGAAF